MTRTIWRCGLAVWALMAIVVGNAAAQDDAAGLFGPDMVHGLVGAAPLLTDYHDRLASQVAEPGDYRRVVSVSAIAVQLDEVADYVPDVVDGRGAGLMSGELHRAPRLRPRRLGFGSRPLAARGDPVLGAQQVKEHGQQVAKLASIDHAVNHPVDKV